MIPDPSWFLHWEAKADPDCRKCDGRGSRSSSYTADPDPEQGSFTVGLQWSACPCTGRVEEH